MQQSLNPSSYYFKHNRQQPPHFFTPHSHEFADTSRSPRQSHTPEDSRFQQLYRNAIQKKEKMEQLAQATRQKFDQNYKFEPRLRINPNKQEYDVGVVERNELWMQQRKKKLVEIEQTEALRKMRPCTFSPNISSKMNTFYLKEKARRQELREQPDNTRQQNNPSRYRQKGKIDYEEAKRNLQKRITTMHI